MNLRVYIFLIVYVGNIFDSESTPTLTMDLTTAVVSRNLTLTCQSDGSIPGAVQFITNPGGDNQGGCTSSGSCGSGAGNDVRQDTSQAKTYLFIPVFTKTRDDKQWQCNDGSAISNTLDLTDPATVLDTSQIIWTPSSLPSTLASGGNLNITVTTPCCYPPPTVTLVVGSTSIATSPVSDGSSCTGNDVTTIMTIILNAGAYSGEQTLDLKIVHPSLFPHSELFLGNVTFAENITTSTQPPGNIVVKAPEPVCIAFLCILLIFLIVVIIVYYIVIKEDSVKPWMKKLLLGLVSLLFVLSLVFIIVILVKQFDLTGVCLGVIIVAIIAILVCGALLIYILCIDDSAKGFGFCKSEKNPRTGSDGESGTMMGPPGTNSKSAPMTQASKPKEEKPRDRANSSSSTATSSAVNVEQLKKEGVNQESKQMKRV